MKHLYCIGKTINNIWRESRLVFVIFMVIQIVVVFAYLFFFTTVPRTTMEYFKSHVEVRSIELTFRDPKVNYPLEELLESIQENNIKKAENMHFYFSTTKEEESSMVASYSIEQKDNTVEGNTISTTNIEKKQPVMIGALNTDIAHYDYQIGDTVERNGIKFQLIGLRKIYSGEEIPYTLGVEKFYLKAMEIQYPTGITQAEKEAIKQHLKSQLSAVEVELPKSELERTIQRLFLILITSIGAGITAVVTFIFLFQFMIENNKRYFQIINLCGASGSDSMRLLLEVFTMLFTGSFLIGLSIYYFTLGKNIGLAWQDVGWVYMTFMGLLVCLTIPTAIRFIGKQKKVVV